MRTSDAPKGINSKEDSWTFEGNAAARELATPGFHGKLQDVKRVCEQATKTVTTTIVDAIGLDRKGIKIKRQCAT